MNKLIKNKKSIYILFAFVSIIIFYLSINILYTQTPNNLPSAEKFVNNIDVTVSKTNDSEILIEWDGINNSNLIYYVYRSESPIIGKYSLINSKVVDYVKATNISKKYIIVDRPVLSSIYYYAVVSYIDNLSFYNAKANVDTLSIIFEGAIKEKYVTDEVTNQFLYEPEYDANIITTTNTITNYYTFTNITATNIVTNYYTVTNTATNYYTLTNTALTTNTITNYYTVTNTATNYYTFTNITATNIVTNYYTVTNTALATNTVVYTNIITTTNVYNLTNTYSVSNVSKDNVVKGTAAPNEYSRYKNEYDRAVMQFKAGNYSSAVSILEPISRRNINRTLYYNINLMLGKCYKNLGRKRNALDAFNRIKTYNAQEVNFWINQVLTDL